MAGLRRAEVAVLAEAGLEREEVFITNVVKHRPPGNRDPLPDEIVACSVWLEKQVEAIDLGTTVLPILLKTYWKQIAAAV